MTSFAPAQRRTSSVKRNRMRSSGIRGGVVRISLDWWAVLAAAVAVVLIKAGIVSRIPW